MMRFSYTTLMLGGWALIGCMGCGLGCGVAGSAVGSAASAARVSGPVSGFALQAGTLTVVVGSSARFPFVAGVSGMDAAKCSWTTSNPGVLAANVDGQLTGISVGSVAVTARCDGGTATGMVAVSSVANPQAIVITTGGTYSGSWRSADPQTAVIWVNTEEPVTIENTTLTGKGDLIVHLPAATGGHLTVRHVTGIGIEPGVLGMPRGVFVNATGEAELSVTDCTMRGVSYGIYVRASALEFVEILRNAGEDLDDRLSDGGGGYLADQGVPGHFVQLAASTMPNGGEIAWNQLVGHTGTTSTEDLFNFGEALASAEHPMLVHDNYLSYAEDIGLTHWYTGGGIQFDGDTSDLRYETAFYEVYDNVIVHTANFGIGVGTGHDIHVRNNRVVSCGQDGNGNWINFGGVAVGLINYGHVAHFYNNSVSGTTGGVVILNQANEPQENDFVWADLSVAESVVAGQNAMDQPCWVNGQWSDAAEGAEWVAWQKRVADAGQSIGDVR